jgi:hypothetical protein
MRHVARSAVVPLAAMTRRPIARNGSTVRHVRPFAGAVRIAANLRPRSCQVLSYTCAACGHGAAVAMPMMITPFRNQASSKPASRIQSGVGSSARSITSTSIGSRRPSSLSPSCACTAANSDGASGAVAAVESVPNGVRGPPNGVPAPGSGAKFGTNALRISISSVAF